MAASINRNVIAADPRTGLVLVFAQDAAGNCTLRIEDWYGARDYSVTKAALVQLAANITSVANS